MAEFNYEDYFSGVDIRQGDILDVASDMLSMHLYCMNHGLKFNEDHMLEVLQDLVGSEGTIMIRTFTWEYCRGKAFYYNRSKSKVGTLGDVARKREDFTRTQHPIYSWAVWGKYQKHLFEMNNTEAFGVRSPFYFLCTHEAKQLRIGNTTVDAFTQLHHAEKIVNIPFRYEKFFNTAYYDWNDQYRDTKYSMFVRRLDLDVVIRNNLIDVEKEWDSYSWKTESRYNGELLRATVNIKDAEDWMEDDLANNYARKLYAINGVEGYQGVIKDKIYENEVE